MARYSVAKGQAIIVIISGELVAKRLSSVYSAEAKSWGAKDDVDMDTAITRELMTQGTD
jgi:hypothetical protein